VILIFRLWFLSSLLFVSQTFANDAETIAPWLPRQCHYSGVFIQVRTLPSLPVPLHSNGAFLVNCEAGVIWQTLSPIGETIIYTSDNISFRISSQIEQLEGIVHQQMSTMLRALMGGRPEYLLQRFSAEIKSDTLVLIPISATVSRYFKQIELTRSDSGIEILLVNSDIANTRISVSETRPLEQPGYEACRSFFNTTSKACDALFSPAVTAESLGTER